MAAALFVDVFRGHGQHRLRYTIVVSQLQFECHAFIMPLLPVLSHEILLAAPA